MTQLHQIQMVHDAHEDRVLLRIKTVEKSEFRFWLTRRYVRLLWPVLVEMLASTPGVSQHADPETKSAVLGFEHERALRQGDFQTRFDDAVSALPLGPEPVLLARIQRRQRPDGVQLLALNPREGQGIELAMNEFLLHSICKLLSEAVGGAEWDLGLASLGEAQPAEPPERVN